MNRVIHLTSTELSTQAFEAHPELRRQRRSALVHKRTKAPGHAGGFLVFLLCLTSGIAIANDPPVVTNSTIIFMGDQSDGIVVSPPAGVHVAVVSNLTTAITPASGTKGIEFQDLRAENVFVDSGNLQSNVVIETTGSSAAGIYAESVGSPGPAPNDPFLGVPIPGSPAASGGVVDVESHTDVTTDGANAHGISAVSRTTGYGPDVLNALENFSETGFTFSVIAVTNADGSAGVVGQPVAGTLIDTNGNAVAGNGGTFLLNLDGTYLFNPGTNFDDLAIGEERQTSVPYGVLGLNPSGVSNLMTAHFVVTMSRNTNGVLEGTGEAYYEVYGVSYKPTDTNHSTVFPDLVAYVDGLKADAVAGGAGNSVSIRSDGAIETWGANAHGIFAQSQGGNGGKGRDGSISHSADPGKPGKAGGAVTVTANGGINTHAPGSVGVLAHSVAGNGGPGGDGGTWRYGQRGGTGGDGGTVTVNGDATIHTFGDFASGVLVLSEGGNGGDGGSGDFVTGGGRGGYGGLGGDIVVDGDWNITTEGDKAHGIWAKSVGGNAGTGGSGGWLAGSPGGGGQATDGGSVTLTSGGVLETWGEDSYALYAQSVGGFGGRGGSGGGIFYAAGGNGNSAGSGGEVNVVNQAGGSLTTHGAKAHALFAQSIGGGGGSGGGAGALVGVGGEGGAGGYGGTVNVLNQAEIRTFGEDARGIYAQSIGGGGGDGGDSGGLVAIGGKGSGTSDGGDVTVTNTGLIATRGTRSSAIFAESIGGGGGDGGSSGGWFSVGGAGGGGGNASNVTIVTSGELSTLGSDSSAVFAQSVGGGGGNGGGAISGGLFGSLAIGGSGATGGDAGDLVSISSVNSITTAGDRSHGIFSQSVGGGGGNGGYAVSASVGSFSMSVALGGDGAGGGSGKRVELDSASDITTFGKDSHGIFAQSVGGGGGSGGFSVAVSVGGGGISGSLSMGGSGAGGGAGGTVLLGNDVEPDLEGYVCGDISTFGDHSYGILAQSVGGGGGDGGFSVAASIGGPSVAVGIGGSGGGGGIGGTVEVYSKSTITTEGKDAHGLVAQSVGGGGGSGGFSIAGSVSGVAGAVSLGGQGGSGNTGGSVTLDSRGDISTGIVGRDTAGVEVLTNDIDSSLIQLLSTHGFTTVSNLSAATTAQLTAIEGIDLLSAETVLFKARNFMEKGDHAYGILAQSVGGSGGDGGFSVGAAIGMGAAAFSMGGAGGDGGIGGSVDVTSESSIVTHGNDAHGMVVQSVGGGGGSGGFSVAGALTAGEPSGGAAASLGGSGGDGNTGGKVTLESGGTVHTDGSHAYGILAQSVGGGGGDGGFSVGAASGQAAAAFSMGGDGGTGGVAGEVEVQSTTAVTTLGKDSHGIVVQSVGGGGGSGGFSVAGSLSSQGGAAASLGGSGGTGNAAGNVRLESAGDVQTVGNHAYGILAQSVGGGGGDGGFSVGAAASKYSAAFSMGGSAGSGGTGGSVDVESASDVATWGRDSHGIIVQSVGGGGGSGGFSVAGSLSTEGGGAASVGGSGGAGNLGGIVTLSNRGEVFTFGDRAYGLLVQSVGGGGGDGGFSVAGTFSKNGPAAAFSLGGSGGDGGSSSNVTLFGQNDVSTVGSNAHAVVVQSIGGGGGSGGFSVAGSVSLSSNNPSVAVSIGGSGGTGGNAGAVRVATTGDLIVSSGERSHGILAQSVGGGGGDGGFSVAGSISRSHNVSFSLGGQGGPGGYGGVVDLENSSRILTQGSNSHGIFAQSLGGGGGSGGFSVAGTLSTGNTNSMQVAVSIGGAGGEGSHSTNVAVRNTGEIITMGDDAHGIFAQSVGGGGGNGGFSAAGVLGRGGDHKNVNVAFSLGGAGGGGGYSGDVDVISTNSITTLGAAAHGIFAQSVGGGGGAGGASYAGIVALDGTTNSKTLNLVGAIGGKGGLGNHAGAVSVRNDGLIDTTGDAAHGIFAQSVGGGGGAGGDARTISVVLGKPAIPILGTSGMNKSGSLAVGGDGAGAGNGDRVDVLNTGDIVTRGADAYGIFAHSIGGGGGAGGGGAHGFSGLGAPIPPELGLIFFGKVKPWKDLSIIVGGSGGSSGNGGEVTVTNSGNITTLGEASYGILAQSVGGGGGIGIASNQGGTAEAGFLGKIGIGGAGGAAGHGSNVFVVHSGNIDTSGAGAHAILAQSIGGGGGIAGDVSRAKIPFTSESVGIGLAWGRGGGSAGDGGEVQVNTTGDITTRGTGAHGILAQSIGGGGGLAGDVGLGIGFAGSVGGHGAGGLVKVNHSGNITTLREGSHGIFAQSAGSNVSGVVEVTLTGNITALGADSSGIFAQSVASSGIQGDISILIDGGTVMGGFGSAAGVWLAGGADNTITNRGTITSRAGVAGTALVGTDGNDYIENLGVVTGSVDLGTGTNVFNNTADGILNAGTELNFGSGSVLTNAGWMSPGGKEVLPTALRGGFVQTGTGTLHFDLGATNDYDVLGISDTALLDGTLSVAGANDFVPKKGDQFIVLTATGGVGGEFVSLEDAYKGQYAICMGIRYAPDLVTLETLQDTFTQFARTENQRAVSLNLDSVSGYSEELIAQRLSLQLQPTPGDPRAADLVEWMNAVPASTMPATLDLIAPEELGAMFDASFSAAEINTRFVERRNQEIRVGHRGFSGGLSLQDPTGRLLAYNGTLGPGLLSGDEMEPAPLIPSEDNPWGLFAAGSAQFIQIGDDDNAAGYDIRTPGVTVGLDYRVGQSVAVGLDVGYLDSTADLVNGGKVDIQGIRGGLYGTWFKEGWYVGVAAGGGYNDYDTRRVAANGTARGSTTGAEFDAWLGGGYDLQRKRWQFGPTLALQYMYAEIDPFTESGSLSPLAVERSDSQSLNTRLGARVLYRIGEDKPGIKLFPEIRVAWQHEFLDVNRAIASSFASGAGGTFTVHSPSIGRDSVAVAAGTSVKWSPRWGSFLFYDGQFAGNSRTANAVSGGISFSF